MLIYKVFSKSDFDSFVAGNETNGSSDDLKDGFIHFSTREQLFDTIRKHFSKYNLVFVLAFQEGQLMQKLKWELSRNLELFPHYYGNLRYSQSLYTIQLII